jgi:hypothetical protein
MEDLIHIKSVTSWDSGGGMQVDLVELTDGRVLGITDESVVLYADMEEAMGSGEANTSRPHIDL